MCFIFCFANPCLQLTSAHLNVLQGKSSVDHTMNFFWKRLDILVLSYILYTKMYLQNCFSYFPLYLLGYKPLLSTTSKIGNLIYLFWKIWKKGVCFSLFFQKFSKTFFKNQHKPYAIRVSWIFYSLSFLASFYCILIICNVFNQRLVFDHILFPIF